MSGMPKRIFAGYAEGKRYWVPHPDVAAPGASQYVHIDEVQALIAEAEKAADAVDMAYGDPHDEETPHRYSAKLRAAIAAIRKRGAGK